MVGFYAPNRQLCNFSVRSNAVVGLRFTCIFKEFP